MIDRSMTYDSFPDIVVEEETSRYYHQVQVVLENQDHCQRMHGSELYLIEDRMVVRRDRDFECSIVG